MLSVNVDVKVVVLVLRTRSPGMLLSAHVVVVLGTLSPPKLLLPADVVVAKSAHSKTRKAVSWGQTEYHWPYCRPVLSAS